LFCQKLSFHYPSDGLPLLNAAFPVVLVPSWHPHHHLLTLICSFFGEKINKFDPDNFYIKETVEQVPEKPLQTHRAKPSSIISGLSIAMIRIFLLRKNALMLCKPKFPRVSKHPEEGVFHFGLLILAMSTRSESILDHITYNYNTLQTPNQPSTWCFS
jgi:hypothetical protein